MRFITAAFAAATLFVCASAKAGGFDELPDQGAQALGRGATFTAKADDATALYWNVAGLARQRGTKLQLSVNLESNSFSFQRTGAYPDDPKDPATPYGGQKFPLVTDKSKGFTLPMLVATSDLGISDRLTFGLGVFAPSATGHTFQLGINGMPSPARYDVGGAGGNTIVYPTLGAAYRVTEHLDLGLAGHLALANIDETSIAYADAGDGACKNVEYRLCDAQGHVNAKGTGAGASIAAMYRPAESLQFGAQVRAPMTIHANGTTTVALGGVGPNAKAGAPAIATATISMPWILRFGGRYISMQNKRELWDMEVDATYETWGTQQATGPTVTMGDVGLGDGKPTTIVSTHHWKDTVSLRAGGAYNVALDEAAESILILRAGAYYDSSATDSAYTRLDVNTLAKVAGTVGLGFKRGAWSANLAYAAVDSLSRTVTDGKITPGNGAKGGAAVDGQGNPLPAVNNGTYSAFSHILSFSVEVNFEALFHDRKSTYGDPAYEDLAPEGQPIGPTPKPGSEDDAKKKSESVVADATPAPAPAPAATPAAEPADPPGTWWKPAADEELPEAKPQPVKKKKKVKKTAQR